jgi:outer membrane immunogenic protein
MLKKLLLGSATAMVVAAGAAAEPNAPDPPFSWTGCYIGAQVGGGGMDSSWAGNTASPGIGAIYGGQAGCNSQVRQFVIGIEGELWGSGINTLSMSNENYYFYTSDSTGQVKNVVDGAIALRLGYAIDRSLFYGKVGAALGRFNFAENSSFTYNPAYCTGCDSGSLANASATLPGLLLGAGFEYAFLDNWTAKIEYNYIAFGTPTLNYQILNTCNSGVPPCPSYSEPASITAAQSAQIVKVGLNYKFNSWSGKFSFGGP